MKTFLLLVSLLTFSMTSHAQGLNAQRVKNFKEFCRYLIKSDSMKINENLLGEKYVDIAYIKTDTNQVRLTSRMKFLQFYAQRFKRKIQGTDIDRLKFEPILEIKELDDKLRDQFKRMDGLDVYRIFVVQDGKTYPNCIAFRQGEVKVLSWILLDQGGYLYFITLNLIGNYKK